MLKCSFFRGELEQVHFYLCETEATLEEEIAELQGYEVALPNRPQDRLTKEDVQKAKETVSPGIHAALKEAKRLKQHTLRQVERFLNDEKAVSRVYSMLSGS